MPKDAKFTLKIEPELRAEFAAAARAVDRPAGQVIREFMRRFIAEQREAMAHEAWMIAEIEEGLRESDDPNAELIDGEEVSEKWRRRRAELLRQAEEKGGAEHADAETQTSDRAA